MLGVTRAKTESGCKCTEECLGWRVSSITLNVKLEISLDLRMIKVAPQPWTLANAYGHEQHHAQNMKKYWENVGFDKFCDTFRRNNEPTCKYWADEQECLFEGCDEYDALISKLWNEMMDGEAHSPDDKNVPLDGVPYDPLPPGTIGDLIK
jgi:hypothetical protein